MIAVQTQRRTRGPHQREETAMTLVIGYHEIDDSAHWLASPKREEVFGPLGITVRTFLDPENPNRAAVLADVPDMAAFQAVMQSQAGADAMAYDGVRADTFVLLVEA
jgi:hypothetical protein